MQESSKNLKVGWFTYDHFIRSFIALGGMVVLYAVSQWNYLLFHTLAEMFSIVVAGGIFIVYWNLPHVEGNNFFTFAAIAYLFVGLIDLFHTLAYKGMGVFPTYDANLPTQLWIAARYLESISLLSAVIFLQKKGYQHRIFLVYATVFFLLIGAIFAGIFPSCYREGTGLTPFKIISEYVIALFLTVTLWGLYQKKTSFDQEVFNLLTASILTTILSELAFTFYFGVTDFPNFLGHILKIASFYLIYLAIIQTGLKKPYSILFRELKEREKALKASETRFRALFENTVSGVAIYEVCDEGNDFIIVDFNRAAEKIESIGKEDIIGKRVKEVFPGIEAFGLLDVFRRVWATGVAQDHPMSIYQDNRIQGWRENYVYKLPTGEIVASYRNLTAQKQAEQALLESLANWQSLTETSPDHILTVDQDLRILYANFASTGLTVEALIGTPIYTQVGEERRDEIKGILEKVLTTGQNANYETSYSTPDGEQIYYETRVTPRSLTAGGEIRGLTLSARDITTRKIAEEARKSIIEELQQHNLHLEERVKERTQALEDRAVKSQRLNQAMTNLMLDLRTNQDVLTQAQAELEESHQLLKQERIQEQTTLLRLSQELLVQNETESILDCVIRELAASFNVHHVVIGLINAESQKYSHIYRYGWAGKVMSIDRDVSLDQLSDFEWVLQSGKPLVISDWKTVEEITPSPSLVRAGIQASLIVPMTVNEASLGVMAVNSLEKREWSEDEIRLLILIANTTAQALRRAQLFVEVSKGREQLRFLSIQLSRAQEDERSRLSRELHDQVGQVLTAVKINLKSLEFLPEGAERIIFLERCVAATDRAIQLVRNFSLDLRPAVLDDLGLYAAIRWFLRRQAEISGIIYDLNVPVFEERMPGDIETICYRVLQEAWTNVVRHAKATSVWVKIWHEADELFMTIRDNGIGFDLGEALRNSKDGNSLGLINMRERVELAGGKLTYVTQPDQGTEIQFHLPNIAIGSPEG